MASVRVTVIIPTLNEEKRLPLLLESLSTQTNKLFEVIVVDGGSTDRTIEVAQKYGSRTICLKNLDEFSSRNLASQKAEGDILLHTSADVIMQKHTIESLISQFDKNEKLTGIYSSGFPYDGPLWFRLEYFFYYFLLNLKMDLCGDYQASTNFMAFRKEKFLLTKGFVRKFSADTLFINEFGRKFKVGKFKGSRPFISGRRAKKMGFFEYNRHFGWNLFFMIPFLRNSNLVKKLGYESGKVREEEHSL